MTKINRNSDSNDQDLQTTTSLKEEALKYNRLRVAEFDRITKHDIDNDYLQKIEIDKLTKQIKYYKDSYQRDTVLNPYPNFYNQGYEIALRKENPLLTEIEDIETIRVNRNGSRIFKIDKVIEGNIYHQITYLLPGSKMNTVIQGYADALFMDYLQSDPKTRACQVGLISNLPTLSEIRAIGISPKFTSLEMSFIVDHFSSAFRCKNKNNKPFLEEDEIIRFLALAFTDIPVEKGMFKINEGKGEMGKVIRNIFYKFWDSANRDHQENRSNYKMYKKLVLNNFSNWDEKQINENFRK